MAVTSGPAAQGNAGASSARTAQVALGALRLTFGSLGLVAPRLLIRRIDRDSADSAAAVYAFRMFGIRTVLLGRDLLTAEGPALRKALDDAPLIHGCDTVTATLLTLSGQVPRRTGLSMIAVSGLNTALSFLARRTDGSPPSGVRPNA